METTRAIPAELSRQRLTQPLFWPAMPDTADRLGLPRALVIDLILNHLRSQGLGSYTSMNQSLKISFPVLETIMHQLRQQQLVEVRGAVGNDYTFVLTGGGRALAAERASVAQYAGPAPVCISDYHEAVRVQSARLKLDRAHLRSALSDLVVSDRLLDQLGPALISQKALFLYGPTGNGKTSLAERLIRVFDDTVLLPYAVEVDGRVIVLFDPVIHREVDCGRENLDPRWVPCRRPCITVGGELAPGMLELRRDDATGIYSAPLQMKANDGILIIDDFGRQVIAPRELLNRWIVPLDRRVDYLTLAYGLKFQIPFELMVVFSTNLDPKELADEAFLRRLPNKIYVDAVDGATFDEIFRRIVDARGVACEPGSAAHLRQLCLARSPGLRACYPADICGILESISRYEDAPMQIDRAGLERAVDLYFTQT